MPLQKLTVTGDLPDMPLKPLGGAKPAGGGISPLVAGGGAAAVIGGVAALALRNPALAGKIAKGLNTLRQQMMLSGFALPKSLLGNAGSAIESSIEGRTLTPLKEMFSGQTLKDAAAAWKSGAAGGAAQAGQAPVGGNIITRTLSKFAPGRAMGAMDEAAQGALRRAGMTAEEAQSAAMQAPLPKQLADALDSPAARYLHPFRRQPFNQLLEGLTRLPGGKQGSTLAKTVYSGAGAFHGAATADDEAPISLPLAIAGSSRYGLTYGLASLAGRALAQGKGPGNAAGSLLPVSEYGYSSAMMQPTRPFTNPAAITALNKILGVK